MKSEVLDNRLVRNRFKRAGAWLLGFCWLGVVFASMVIAFSPSSYMPVMGWILLVGATVFLIPALAKRHEVKTKKDFASVQEFLAEQLGTYDESELCKLLREISLLDSACQRSTTSLDDIVIDAAKRYRGDTEKLQKAVAKKFAAKRDKRTIKPQVRRAVV